MGSSSIEPMFRCAGAYSLALCTYTDKKTSDNHVLTQHAAKACVNCVLPLTLTLNRSLQGNAVRPLPCNYYVIQYFHGGNTGSNPVGDAKPNQQLR